MSFKFANAATATLASSITSASTSITVSTGLGALFPTLLAGQKYPIVLVDSSNNYEFAVVTARTGDVMTVTRAQEGTTALSFASGSRVELRLTSAVLNNFAQLDLAQTFTAANTFSGATTFSAATSFSAVATHSAAVVLQAGGTLTGTFDGNPTLSGNPIFSGIPSFSNGATFTNSLIAETTATVWFKGTTRAANALIGSNDTYLYEPAANAFGVRTGASGSYKYFSFAANGDLTTPGNATVGGNFTASGDITAFSDERLKTDWMPLQPNFIEELASVKSGSFLRTDIGKFQIGVGAQSLQRIMPYAIHQENDGYLSVNYGAAAMVSCVELAKEVVSLKAEIAALKGN